MRRTVWVWVSVLLCLMLVGCGGNAPEPTPNITATATLENPNGTITALFETAVIVAQFTPVPTSTPTPVPPTATPFPPGFTPTLPTQDMTLTSSSVTLEAMIQSDLNAPITISLPQGWVTNNFNLPLLLGDMLSTVPFTYYAGPMADGQATIAVLWGFDNITPVDLSSEEDLEVINLWSDGVRLLVTGLLEPGCNPGLDVERDFMVGDREAVGSFFSAVECPESPDISGWFAVLEIEGLNFAFFVYFEPRDRFTGDILQQLQAIIDTVRFDLSLLPAVVPTFPVVLSPTPTP